MYQRLILFPILLGSLLALGTGCPSKARVKQRPTFRCDALGIAPKKRFQVANGEFLGGSSTSLRRQLIKVAWRRAIDPSFGARRLTWRLNPEETARPVLDPEEGHLFVGNEQRFFSSLSAKTGKIIWSKRLQGRVVSAATFDQDRVYVGTTSGLLYALSRQTGKEIWKYQAKGEILSSPVLIPEREDKDKEIPAQLAFTSSDNKLQVLQAKDGKWLWQVKHDPPEQLTIRGQAPPTLHNGILYTGFSDGTVIALRVEDTQQLWKVSLRDNDRFPDVDSPLTFHKGKVFAASYNGALHAIDAKTGKKLWKHKLKFASKVAIKHNEVFATNPEGDIVSLNKESGKVRWKSHFKHAKSLGAPVVYNNNLILGDRNGMKILDIKKLNALRTCLQQHKKVYKSSDLELEKIQKRYQKYTTVQKIRLGHGLASRPIVSSGMMYAFTNEGKLYAFRLQR